jgi:hypothetical protein
VVRNPAPRRKRTSRGKKTSPPSLENPLRG